MISMNNVTKTYLSGEQSVTALCSVSISLEEKGLVAIVGESGSGKTTFLNVISGLDKPTQGEVIVDGISINDLSELEKENFFAEKLGFVFQDYNVFDNLTVNENIGIPLEILGYSESEIKEKTTEILRKLGLFELESRKIKALSGGQKQRVAIARACINKPAYIFADEPTGNLDGKNSVDVFTLLKKISLDCLVICVTHDKRKAVRVADRIIEIEDGCIKSDKAFKNNFDNISFSLTHPFFFEGNTSAVFEQIIIDARSKEKEQYIIKTRCDDSNSFVKNSDTINEKNHVAQSLKWKLKKKMAGGILEKRKKSIIVATALMSLCIFLLLFVTCLAFFKPNPSIVDYLSRYKVREINTCYDVNEKTIRVSNRLDDLSKKITDCGIYHEYSASLYVGSNLVANGETNLGFKQLEVIIRVVPNDYFMEKYQLTKITGNEIAITDYVANALGLDDKSDDISIFSGENEFVVVASEHQNMTDSFVYKDSYDNYQQYLMDTQYACVYIPQKSVDYLDLLDCGFEIFADFTAPTLIEYAECSLRVPSKDESDYKTISMKRNDVILSYSFIDRRKVSAEDVVDKTFNLRDIYSEECQERYSDRCNLYDILGETVHVIGLMDFDGDIIFSDEVRTELSVLYNSVYRFSGTGIITDNIQKNTRMASKLGLRFDDVFLDKVYEITAIKKTIAPLIITIFTVVLMVVFFILILQVAFLINDNRRNIGILKSLGVKQNDIRGMFLLSPVRMLFMGLTVGIVLMFLFSFWINRFFYESQLYRKYWVFIPQWGQITMVTVTIIIIAFFDIIIPMRKLSSFSIVENIRD